MAGQQISVVTKQPYVFEGATSQTQTIVLASLIDARAWKSGVLTVRYATRTSWTAANGSFQVVVRSAMWGPDDPENIYVSADDLAAAPTIVTGSAAGLLTSTAFSSSYAIGPYVRVLGLWAQGGSSGAASFSIAVDLLGRDC